MQYRIWIYLIDFGRAYHVYQAFKLGNSSTIGCIRTMVMVMINGLGSTWRHFTTQHPTRNRHLGLSKHGGTHQNHAIFMGKHDPSKSKSITKIRQSSSITKIHQNSNKVPITISSLFLEPPIFPISLPFASRMKAGQSARASNSSERGEGPARQRRRALPTWQIRVDLLWTFGDGDWNSWYLKMFLFHRGNDDLTFI